MSTSSETLRLELRVLPTEGCRAVLVLVVVVATVAVGLRAPGLLAVAVPLVLGVLVDLLAARPDALDVDVLLPAGRVLEGDTVDARCVVRGAGLRGLTVLLATTGHLRADGPDRPQHRPGADGALDVPHTAVRWGAAGVEELTVTWRSPLGLLVGTSAGRPAARPVRVHPPVARLRALLGPRRTGAWSGVRPASTSGRGVEFAELRPYAPGDLPRDLSWRVSARRGEPWVASRHPERSIDVVLLLDAFHPEALAQVVRAAATLLEAYLADRDRVGVLGLSGVLEWVAPGGGERHRARLLDQLLRTQAVATWATRDLATVPARALPPGALVVACTRLSPAMAAVVTDLLARRRDVVVLDLEPAVPDDAAGVVARPSGEDVDLRACARRLVALEREDARDRLRRRGATVVPVPDGTPLATAVAVATRVRRGRRAVP